eukprot:501728-Ditylum_brightwellii.AAC.1
MLVIHDLGKDVVCDPVEFATIPRANQNTTPMEQPDSNYEEEEILAAKRLIHRVSGRKLSQRMIGGRDFKLISGAVADFLSVVERKMDEGDTDRAFVFGVPIGNQN